MHGDEVYKELTVTKSDTSVRIAAGTYRVVIDGTFDGVELVDGRVDLERQSAKVVSITRSDLLEKSTTKKTTTKERKTDCLLYTSPSPRDLSTSRMPSSA